MTQELCALAAGLLHSVALLSVPAPQPNSGTLRITISGIRNVQGELDVSLFRQKDGFPDKTTQAFRRGRGRITGSTCTVAFADLPFGAYAVSAFHDENNDGTLNTTWYGMPKEGVAVSRGRAGERTGRPSFEEALFDFRTTGQGITLPIVYL